MTDYNDFKTFDFTTLNGVGASTAKKIQEGYTGWDEVKKLSVKKLTERVAGVSPRIATQLKDLAKAQYEEDDPRHTSNTRKTSAEVREEMAKAAAIQPEPEKKHIISIKIDQFSTATREVKNHPGLCKECGFDLLQRNNLPEWDFLDSLQQQHIQQSLREHMARAHGDAGMSETEKVLKRIKERAAAQYQEELTKFKEARAS